MKKLISKAYVKLGVLALSGIAALIAPTSQVRADEILLKTRCNTELARGLVGKALQAKLIQEIRALKPAPIPNSVRVKIKLKAIEPAEVVKINLPSAYSNLSVSALELQNSTNQYDSGRIVVSAGALGVVNNVQTCSRMYQLSGSVTAKVSQSNGSHLKFGGPIPPTVVSIVGIRQ